MGDLPPGQRCDIVTSSVGVPRATSQMVIHQHAPIQTFSTSSSAYATAAFTFSLSGLDGAGTFQQMFEFYKMRAIRVSILPQNNAIGVLDPTVTKLVSLYCILDYNDSTPPSSSASMLEVDNCVVLAPGQSVQRTFRPHMASPVRSAAGTDYMSVEPQWLNTGSDDVLHYGLKLYAPQVLATQSIMQTWTVDIEFWLEFSKITG